MSTGPENQYLSPQAPPETVEAQVSAEPPKRNPRVWPVVVVFIASLVLSFGLQALMGVVLVIYFLSTGTQPRELQETVMKAITHPAVFSIMATIGPGSFGVAAFAAAWFSPEGLWPRLGMVPVRCSRSIYWLSMIGSIFPLAAGMALAHMLTWFAPEVPVDPTAKLLFEQMTPLWSIPFIVVIGLVPGFCEEMLFRGYMQMRLTARWGPLVGIPISSVVFGCAHVMPHAIIFATLLGVWFGVIAWKSGSIWPTICCHAFVNSGLNTWRTIAKYGEIPDNVIWVVHAVAIAIGAVCFVVALWVLFRSRESDESVTQPALS